MEPSIGMDSELSFCSLNMEGFPNGLPCSGLFQERSQISPAYSWSPSAFGPAR